MQSFFEEGYLGSFVNTYHGSKGHKGSVVWGTILFLLQSTYPVVPSLVCVWILKGSAKSCYKFYPSREVDSHSSFVYIGLELFLSTCWDGSIGRPYCCYWTVLNRGPHYNLQHKHALIPTPPLMPKPPPYPTCPCHLACSVTESGSLPLLPTDPPHQLTNFTSPPASTRTLPLTSVLLALCILLQFSSLRLVYWVPGCWRTLQATNQLPPSHTPPLWLWALESPTDPLPPPSTPQSPHVTPSHYSTCRQGPPQLRSPLELSNSPYSSHRLPPKEPWLMQVLSDSLPIPCNHTSPNQNLSPEGRDIFARKGDGRL